MRTLRALHTVTVVPNLASSDSFKSSKSMEIMNYFQYFKKFNLIYVFARGEGKRQCRLNPKSPLLVQCTLTQCVNSS